MKAQFIVTIEGNWIDGSRTVTHADVEKELRKAVKDGFEFLADRVTVKRFKKQAEAHPVFAKDCTIETFSQSEIDGYVRHLAWWVWNRHYREISPDFVLLSETLGVLTQLDNMLTGWTSEAQQSKGCRKDCNCLAQCGDVYAYQAEQQSDEK